jgi:hypothetical protein
VPFRGSAAGFAVGRILSMAPSVTRTGTSACRRCHSGRWLRIGPGDDRAAVACPLSSWPTAPTAGKGLPGKTFSADQQDTDQQPLPWQNAAGLWQACDPARRAPASNPAIKLSDLARHRQGPKVLLRQARAPARQQAPRPGPGNQLQPGRLARRRRIQPPRPWRNSHTGPACWQEPGIAARIGSEDARPA